MSRSLLTAFFLFCLSAFAQQRAVITGRSVYHTDGTFTESVQDLSLRTQTERTYAAKRTPDAPNVLISRKVYSLNEKLEPTQGQIYDGRGQLQARVLFLFDAFGRKSEQRFINLNNQVYQSIFFTYDSKGKAQSPKSQTYNVDSPNMRPAATDFTNGGNAAPGTLDRSMGAPGVADFRGNVQQLPTGPVDNAIRVGADGRPIGNTQTTTPPTEKKKSFWQKLGIGK